METPFVYYNQVTGKNFLGRREECVILGNLLQRAENIVIYAPPKSGKSSLIQQTLMKTRVTGFQFVVGEFSLMNIRKVQDFLIRYGSTILRALCVSPGEYEEMINTYLAGTHFVFDKIAYENADAIISTNWDLDDHDAEAMLSLPMRICKDKMQNLILILDEFQNILLSDGGDKICVMLGRTLEKYRNYTDGGKCSLVFCGSMVNAMEEIFRHTNWFWRQVEFVPVKENEEKEIIEYIHRGFMLGGKEIDRALLPGVCRLFRCNMWYINHFMSICNSLSRGYIIEATLTEALKIILSIHEPRFFGIMEGLTTFQVNLLKAILDGNTRFSSAVTIREYGLNSSANVKRLKEALMKKEIIFFNEKEEPVITDPLFEYWVRRFYFGEK